MLHTLIDTFAADKATDVAAHCDVPCAIYDPAHLLIASLTVVRMIDIMEELEGHKPDNPLVYHNTMARAVAMKEKHAEIVKHEVRSSRSTRTRTNSCTTSCSRAARPSRV